MWGVERSEVQAAQLHGVSSAEPLGASAVFASTLEELPTELRWRAMKSPHVCAKELPCSAFALTKTFNNISVCLVLSLLIYPLHC